MTITAKIICDSVSAENVRLTTLQLRYPKFIHGEFMTHRVFSRNASSSRAIPVERLIQDVIDDPVYPSFWGKNQPGMSANEECNTVIETGSTGISGREICLSREEAWGLARNNAVSQARAFAKAGYHKQIVNRLLEPFCHINVVVTATEWSNFFELRLHKDAQPEMRLLAEVIRRARHLSEPRPLKFGEWHLPYVSEDTVQSDENDQEAWALRIRLSVARCARVSYLTQDGKTPNIEDDLKLYDRLVGAVPLHASPAEHQATPDQRYEHSSSSWRNSALHGNFRGWQQYRKMLELGR